MGAPERSPAAPRLIQSRSNAASIELRPNRRPPSWGMIPDGLSRTRLLSGAITLTRRALASCVSETKSNEGSSPRRLSRKPPLPFAFPWQAPALQPALEKSGTMSVRSPGGRTQAARSTVSSTEARRSPRLTTSDPWPSALGAMRPFRSISAIAAGSTRKRHSRVTSRIEPSAWRSVTASCCPAPRPMR